MSGNKFQWAAEQLDNYRKAVGAWSLNNLGNTLPKVDDPTPWSLLRCVAGMTEEIGELLDQIETATVHPRNEDEIYDALGDICIYALDFLDKYDMSFQHMITTDLNQNRWEHAYFKVLPDDYAVDALTTGLVIVNARLTHHVLKHSQGIRKHENHLEQMKLYMCHIWRLCYRIAEHYRWNLNFIVERTALKVLGRDWVNNPDHAHEDSK
jgi:NTP pyrophosphatase (non-canonical NTP hydrolase)